ncbi:MAG TPA: hypothetical protein V6D28_30280 [Leptolyngbyaceae cyanobacterium]
MIPPASIRQKWSLLAIAALFPITLIGITFPQQATQARQQPSTSSSSSLRDGIYLYGNSPQPNQVASHYVVFERRKGEVVGAFYSPQSEFNCFAGNIQGTQLKVEAIMLGEPRVEQVSAQLANLYPLQSISSNDQRILTVCKQQTIALASRK